MSFRTAIARLTQSRFACNVAIVASGTAGAQAITMAFAPFITRLYGPEAFGVLGTFVAILAIVTPLAALSYPIAIVLPKDDADALGIAQLSVLIAMVMASITTMILLVFRELIIELLHLEAIGAFIFLIPMAMLFSVGLAVMSQWVIRKKLFKIKAKVTVAQAFVLNGAKLGFGLVNPGVTVLVVLSALEGLLHALMLLVSVRQAGLDSPVEQPRAAPFIALAKRHRDFPLYRVPQDLINSVSQGLPILMLATFVGSAAAGFYTLARSVLGLPAALIAQSVGQVFYPWITEASHRGECQYKLIVKVTLGLAAVGIAPFGIVFIFGPWLFSFVFGAEWIVAGEYARWLSLMLFFNFINRPSVAAVPVLGLQRGLVIYEVFSTGTEIIALYLGFIIFESDWIAIVFFCISGAIAYMTLIFWIIIAARNADMGMVYVQKTS